MKPQIICHLCSFSAEYPGGFIDSILCLARNCREKLNLESLCLFPEEARARDWLKKLADENVLYDFVPRKRMIVFELQKLLQTYDPVVLHSHFFTFDVSTLLLKFLVFKNAKTILHFHSLAEMTLLQRLKDLIKVSLLSRSLGDRFIAVGEGVLRNGIKRGYPPHRTDLIHNGIDMRRFAYNGSDRSRFRRSHGLSEQQTAFLMLGYNPLIKGVDLFVKAAHAFHREHNGGALFLIIGRKETREYVSSMPEAAEIGSFLRLSDPTDDFPLFLNGVDFLVSPSRSEGLSYAVAEAMAAGKLIISSEVPGIRESYGKSDGVWLFPIGDWQRLAFLMERAMQLPRQDRTRLGCINSIHVMANHSLEKWAQEMGEVYSKLLAH